MIPAEAPAAFRRAEALVADSGLGRLARSIYGRSMETVRASRTLDAMRRRAGAFERMTPTEKAQCVLVVVATAVGGHVIAALALPMAARPQVVLTALLLIVLSIAAVADAARRR